MPSDFGFLLTERNRLTDRPLVCRFHRQGECQLSRKIPGEDRGEQKKELEVTLAVF